MFHSLLRKPELPEKGMHHSGVLGGWKSWGSLAVLRSSEHHMVILPFPSGKGQGPFAVMFFHKTVAPRETFSVQLKGSFMKIQGKPTSGS